MNPVRCLFVVILAGMSQMYVINDRKPGDDVGGGNRTLPGANRRARPRDQCLHQRVRRRGENAGARGRSRDRCRPLSRAAAWRADLAQGSDRHGRHAHDCGVTALARPCATHARDVDLQLARGRVERASDGEEDEQQAREEHALLACNYFAFGSTCIMRSPVITAM